MEDGVERKKPFLIFINKLIWGKPEEWSFLGGEMSFMQWNLCCQKQKIRMAFAFNAFVFPYPLTEVNPAY